jgi:DNA processing protein
MNLGATRTAPGEIGRSAANELPEWAFAAALASVPKLGPRRLLASLQRHSPSEAWERLRSGRYLPDDGSQFNEAVARESARIEPADAMERCVRLGIAVHVLGDAGYPPTLAADPFAPAVLFSRGSLASLDQRTVGIVGTRRATASGRAMASEFGQQLAEAGVAVVSGLALGIDGAAHRGVLRASVGAPPIAVVGSGLDMVYPERHADLWNEVAERGLLLSEVPPGAPAASFRFPLRNRIIAALSEVLVVVESHERGGSLLTAGESAARDRTVLAVPGSPRNPASVGTNQLIRDLAASPIHDVTDILLALGLGTMTFAVPVDPRSRPGGFDSDLLDLLGSAPVTLDTLVAESQRSLGDVAIALARLELAGWVIRSGFTYEAVPMPHAGGVLP